MLLSEGLAPDRHGRLAPGAVPALAAAAHVRQHRVIDFEDLAA
jgi:hypothetical protein